MAFHAKKSVKTLYKEAVELCLLQYSIHLGNIQLLLSHYK